MKTTFATAAALLIAAPALANTTIVTCPGYAISMSDDVAIQAEVLAGTQTAFENAVCERSQEAADLRGGPKIIPVFIEELNVTTRVTIFPTKEEK